MVPLDEELTSLMRTIMPRTVGIYNKFYLEFVCQLFPPYFLVIISQISFGEQPLPSVLVFKLVFSRVDSDWFEQMKIALSIVILLGYGLVSDLKGFS